MSHGASPLAAFHLIGDRLGLETDLPEQGPLRPALFGNYQELSTLRYDFPLVLSGSPGDATWIKSLTDIIDEVLQEIAEPGVDGEVVRRQVLAQDLAIRKRLASGDKGTLSELWRAALSDLPGSGDEELDTNLARAFEAIGLDGEIIDCNKDLAAKLLERSWQESEHLKAGKLHVRIERLAQKLIDILEVDHMHSPEARNAGQLQKSMGSDDTVFDFQAMAELLRSTPAVEPLPEVRKRRIKAAIEVLKSQRMVAATSTADSSGVQPHNFIFSDCASALEAFQERLPEIAALIKAISIAELEIDNHYIETRHDRFFDNFSQDRLGPGDLQLFSSYLVCMDSPNRSARMQILEILGSGLPFKILAQTDDILGDDSISGGQLSFGTQGQQLARMAMGLDQSFVMQAANSALYRLQQSVLDGVSCNRPALFSIYAGPGYLESAAAIESRTFPCFVFNPSAGRRELTRFSLAGNPQPVEDWPQHGIDFEGADHESMSEQMAFTLADFIALDPYFAGRLACIPRDEWTDELVPVDQFIQMSEKERADKVPYTLLIDDENVLYRAVIEEKLIDATFRCRTAWHNLQELERSHLPVSAVTVADESVETTPPAVDEKPEAATVEAKRDPAPAPAAAPAPSSDDPWIESIRCTTCNECTQLNDRMFAYDGEMRAYVADPDAGTYRELVEAAETCQVAIIHPGKPRNPDEPGLEELLERAEPFL